MLARLRGKAFSWWGRYWAFWLPWMLVACIGPVREVARLHFLGSGLEPDLYGQPWAPAPEYNYTGDKAAEELPAGFDHDIRRFWNATNAPNGSQPGPDAAWELVKRYPNVQWLNGLGVWAAMSGSQGGYTGKEALLVRAMTRRAIAQEPDNAFPALCAALWEYQALASRRHVRRSHHKKVSAAQERAEEAKILRLWHAAAAKKYYEDHQKQVFRCLLASREAQSHLTAEEKYRLLFNLSGYDYGSLVQLERWTMQRARAFRARNDPIGAVATVLDTTALGSLMLHSKGLGEGVRCGFQFLDEAATLWTIVPDATLSSRFSTPSPIGRRILPWKRFASAHGQPAASKLIAARAAEVDKLWKWRNGDWPGRLFATHSGNFLALGMGRDIGMALVYQGTFVLTFWLATAALFWRQLPVASSRRDRAGVALGCALICATLALVSCVIINRLPRGIPPVWVIATVVISTVLSFVGPVLFSWLVCATLTWGRKRKLFELDPRASLELALSPAESFLMSRYLALGAWGSVLLMVGSGLCWLLTSMVGVGGANIAAWWPHSAIYDWEINCEEFFAAGCIYGLWATLAALVLWILKWRYATAQRTRPATFAALRWWKESLGAYLVILAWLYLGVGLAYWPQRAAANAQFERIVRVGTLEVWRETAP